MCLFGWIGVPEIAAHQGTGRCTLVHQVAMVDIEYTSIYNTTVIIVLNRTGAYAFSGSQRIRAHTH